MTGQHSSIVHALFDVSERTPDALCVRFEGVDYSYRRVREEAVRWETYLRYQHGIAPGERVALFLDNSPAFLGAYLGAHLLGAIVVLVNTQYKQVELRHILSDAGVRLCITDSEREIELDRVADEVPAMARLLVSGDSWGLPPHVTDEQIEPRLPDPEEVALIAYTSGTTGRSKGAMLLHRNLAANSSAVTAAWHWTAQDRLLLTLPLFHIHGLGVGINGTLLAGASVDLRRRFEASAVYDALATGAATMFFGVPTMYTRLIGEARKRKAAGGSQSPIPNPQSPIPPRLFVSGSAPLSPQTFGEFEELFGQRILERYGMTETIMNLTNPYEGERRPGTVGMPFPGQEARIVDVRTRTPITDERTGEIQVRGPHVFKGYWQRPDATAEAFDSEGWFNTGDLGSRSADGYYTISGRARELIISGGYNIYPREIEEVLLTHPAVAEAAVLGMPHPEFGEQVVAAVVLWERGPRTEERGASSEERAASSEQRELRSEQRGASSEERGASSEDQSEDVVREELIAWCRDQLAAYKKPRKIVFVASLPRNALGKVQKHLIKEALGAGR